MMDQGTRPTVSKWLWITLIIVVVVAIVLGTWYYLMGPGKKVATTTTPSTTTATTDQLLAGYEKYTNDTYGFSFQYPETWTSTKVEATTETSAGVLAKDLVYKVRFYDPNAVQKSGPVTSDDVYMRVYKKTTSSTTLNAWLISTYKLPNSELSDYAVGKEITLGGQKGFFSSIGCCAQVDRNYVVEKGDYIYSLGSGHFDNDIKDVDMPATFQKIAPTFKFIAISAAAAATADWKTYTNTDLGFSFKYPKDWSTVKLNVIDSKEAGKEWGGKILMASDGKNGTTYFDSNKIFEFLAYNKDYVPYEGGVLQTKSVDPNWSLDQFISNMKTDKSGMTPLFVKKLSDKALLVGIYGNIECSPFFNVEVITPLNTNYPNLEINVHGVKETDQKFKDAVVNNPGTEECDKLPAYTVLAKMVEDNTYSTALTGYIQTAQQIADSLTTTK